MAEILIGNVKGPQGDTGATGATGPQGEAATVNVGSVSTTAYGNAAQVINVGTENDAILNFIIPQGKPGERTTTMGSLTLDTITTSTADFPSPAVGDTGATAFGKIVKFFADALSAIQAKLDAANVVNNLTTTEVGYALDARQGKALNDSMTTKTAVSTVDMNTNSAGGSGTIHLIKFGNVVTVTGTFRPSTTGTNLNVAFMPSGYDSFKPSFTTVWLSCDWYTTSGQNRAEASITTAGTLVLSTPVSNVDIKISGAYVVNN